MYNTGQHTKEDLNLQLLMPSSKKQIDKIKNT